MLYAVVSDVTFLKTRYAKRMGLREHKRKNICTYDPIVLGLFLESGIGLAFAARGVEARVLDAPALSRICAGGGGGDSDSIEDSSDWSLR